LGPSFDGLRGWKLDKRRLILTQTKQEVLYEAEEETSSVMGLAVMFCSLECVCAAPFLEKFDNLMMPRPHAPPDHDWNLQWKWTLVALEMYGRKGPHSKDHSFEEGSASIMILSIQKLSSEIQRTCC
jgi:hypothetical protein